ncbi:MAG TPA: hypothetical protein VF342_16750 [Alphaproteobacteria bacterium]
MKHIATMMVAGALVAGPSSDAVARCLTDREQTAFRVRMLQTELMVAALSCRGVPGRDFTGQYNVFVKKHEDQLISHGRVLQSYFGARYGADARRQLDAYITSLANEVSRRSMLSPTFCDESVSLFQEAVQLERKQLDSWSAQRASSYPMPFERCGAEPLGTRASAAR